MIGFLRRVFGGHGPSIYADKPDDAEYDADTQMMLISSADLLEHMLAKGEDMDSERVINHFFIGDDVDIDRALTHFETIGLLIGEYQNGRLHVVERNVISIGWIERTIPLMFRRAGEFDLEYDGWDIGRVVGARDIIFINP